MKVTDQLSSFFSSINVTSRVVFDAGHVIIELDGEINLISLWIHVNAMNTVIREAVCLHANISLIVFFRASNTEFAIPGARIRRSVTIRTMVITFALH